MTVIFKKFDDDGRFQEYVTLNFIRSFSVEHIVEDDVDSGLYYHFVDTTVSTFAMPNDRFKLFLVDEEHNCELLSSFTCNKKKRL